MSSIGAVVLAAGGSSRLGQPKQLLKFRGETLVRRAVAAALGAGCAKVVVVAGASDDAIREELRETPAAVVRNSEWKRGLGTSIRCGLQFLIASSRDLKAIVLLACDQPFVEADVVAGLIAEAKRSGTPIVASSYANTLGVPAFFDGSCFSTLLDLPDESGAKSVIQSRIDEVASVPFETARSTLIRRKIFAPENDPARLGIADVTIKITENAYITDGGAKRRRRNVYPETTDMLVGAELRPRSASATGPIPRSDSKPPSELFPARRKEEHRLSVCVPSGV